MKIITAIIVFLMIAFHVVLPITHAIKKSFNKTDGARKFSIKDFFENMFFVILPWLLIVLFIILFLAFGKLTGNLAVTSILTVVIFLIIIKSLDR